MQPRLEPSPSRMDGYKGKLWKLPVTFSFAKNQFFPSTNNPESCHRWENIVVLEIRKRNSTVWEWSWMSFSCTIFNLRTKTFLRELQKSDYFSIPLPWHITQTEHWYLPKSCIFPISWKKSFPNFLKEISRLLQKFLPHWMAEWNQMRVLSQQNIKRKFRLQKRKSFRQYWFMII